jgi:hypothetical protein
VEKQRNDTPDVSKFEAEQNEPLLVERGSLEDLTEEGPPGNEIEPKSEQLIWGD